MTIAREEIFGPVLAVIDLRGRGRGRRARQRHDLRPGRRRLDAGRQEGAPRRAKALKAGTVWVNTYNLYDPGLPFGGYKQSGFGRERGHCALEEYTQVKSVWVDLT